MATRRFEFSEGSLNKFWEITLSSGEYTLTFGRTGTAGQTRTKTFSSPELCGPAAETLVKEKLEKGYREVASTDGRALVGEAPLPTMRYTLTHPESPKPWIILVTGQRIVTNNISQVLPSIPAAADHVARLLSIRKKEGYVLTATEEVAPE